MWLFYTAKRLSLAVLLISSAQAQTFSAVPYVFVGGTQANASQVMADFQSVVNNGNAVAASLASQIASITPPPSGAIMFFNLAVCPAGWTQQAAYNSLFIRGLDLGRGMDPGNTLGQIETDVTQDHAHSTSNIVTGTGTNNITQGGASAFLFFTSSNSTDLAIGNPTTGAHGAETRPANVSLLLCQKN